jgi:hypothetical protein
MNTTLRINLFALATCVAGCATSAGPSQTPAEQPAQSPRPHSTGEVTKAPLTYTPEVRKSSHADDRLFNDMTHAIGGVDFYDRVVYPKATTRVLTRIEVITPYDNHQTGIERWTIQHDGDTSASYVVRFMPDGKGGTDFAVSKDKGVSTP